MKAAAGIANLRGSVLGEEAVAALLLGLAAEGIGLVTRQASDADAIDRLFADLGLHDGGPMAIQYSAELLTKLVRDAAGVLLAAGRGELDGEPAASRRLSWCGVRRRTVFG